VVALPEFELEMDDADLKWFRQHVGTPRCFEASLRTNGASWPIWVGYRGNYSRRFPKASYDIWFGERRPFSKHRRLHLNAAYRDPSLLRGRLALSIFDDIGVPTPAAWHVRVSLNGRDRGVYTALESVDAGWVDRQAGEPDAIYYGVGSLGTFGLVDPYTGEKKRDLSAGYEKAWPPDEEYADLKDLIYAITLPDHGQFEDEINHVMDVESVLRWLVGLEFMSHTDGVVQNYALFRSVGGRWRTSPWDCDGTWGRMPNGDPLGAHEMDVATGEDNYLFVRLLATRRWSQLYRTLWSRLLDGPLSVGHVDERLSAIYHEIREDVLTDSHKRRSNNLFLREPARIRQYVKERIPIIRSRLRNLPR
jgi:spore coat protein H